MDPKPTVVICDADEDYRFYLSNLLREKGWSVEASVGTVQEALQHAVETRPQLVTLHFLRSGLNNDFIARFRAQTGSRLVVLTGMEDWGYGADMADVDVDGVVSKWLDADDLVEALAGAAAG